MFNIGPSELLVILVLALIVVGPQKLPELSRQIGRGLREFRKVQDEVKDMVKFDLNDEGPATRRTGPATPRPHRSARAAAATSGGSESEATSIDEPSGTPAPPSTDEPPVTPTPAVIDQPPVSPTPTDVPPTSPTPPAD